MWPWHTTKRSMLVDGKRNANVVLELSTGSLKITLQNSQECLAICSGILQHQWQSNHLIVLVSTRQLLVASTGTCTFLDVEKYTCPEINCCFPLSSFLIPTYLFSLPWPICCTWINASVFFPTLPWDPGIYSFCSLLATTAFIDTFGWKDFWFISSLLSHVLHQADIHPIGKLHLTITVRGYILAQLSTAETIRTLTPRSIVAVAVSGLPSGWDPLMHDECDHEWHPPGM